MDDLLGEVLDLQAYWTARNTSEMARRGVVIRTELPDAIREQLGDLATHAGVPAADLKVEGRDGTGLKTEIPWVRIFSQEASPSATAGWYVVYLFSARGDRVFLTLMQGTTRWTGQTFVPREPAELRDRVAWARPVIQPYTIGRSDLVEDIALDARSSLGAGYQAGVVTAVAYERDSIPRSDVLREDLRFMVRLLGALYAAERTAPYVPGDAPPEVVEAEESAAQAAGRRRVATSRGQGTRLTQEERREVERWSVRRATEYFEAQGWHVKDVGANQSYDLLLTREDERLHVEVKGTTSRGEQVVLTRAEVERQRQLSPDNALVVVYSIELDRTAQPPTPSGGVLHCFTPWTIEDDDLTVVSYVYKTGL